MSVMPHWTKRIATAMKSSWRRKMPLKQEDAYLRIEEEKGLRAHGTQSAFSQISIALIGVPGIGKNRFASRLIHGLEWVEYGPVAGASGFSRTLIQIADRSILVELQCSSPLPENVEMRVAVQQMKFYILAYNTGSLESFEAVRGIHGQTMNLRLQRPWKGGLIAALTDDRPHTGNAVETRLGRQFADELGVGFVESSLRTGQGCNQDDLGPLIQAFAFRNIVTG
nr:hypothetical protein CFP56_04555 [Quercus suber]